MIIKQMKWCCHLAIFVLVVSIVLQGKSFRRNVIYYDDTMVEAFYDRINFSKIFMKDIAFACESKTWDVFCLLIVYSMFCLYHCYTVCNIISYHIISYHIISYHIIDYIIYHISYHVMSCHVIYHISYHIIFLSYIISYHIIFSNIIILW